VFTGIVHEVGRIVSLVEPGSAGLHIDVEAPATARATGVGDSVSVSGCCLTAVAVVGDTISFDAVPETLARTSLGTLAAGDEVNLEPALRAGDPLGGHYVQGHVDGVARVDRIETEGIGKRLVVSLPPELARYCVEKGSIALQGVSLTVAAVADSRAEIALIPETLAQTTLGHVGPGDALNVEVDVLAKYVEKLVSRA
jgi:riboflavin synthase